MAKSISFRYWLALVGVMLVVTWLSARNLNADGVWYDEWWSLYNAGADWFGTPLSPVDMWNRLATEDPWQLPGYPWILSAWGNTVGWTEYTTRAISLLAGVLAIAVTYRLALEVSGSRIAAIGAAATMGSSTWLIYYMHEIRGYTIIVLLTALLLLIYWRMIKRTPNIWMYAAFLLTMVALLYIHYFCALFVAVLGLWHLIRLRTEWRNRHWWLTLVCFALAGATLLPFVANVLYATGVTQTQQRAQVEGLQLIAIVGDMIYVFSNTGIALVVVLAFFSLRSKTARGFWVFTVILLALDLAGYYYLKVNELRYGMTVLPLLGVIAGFGVYELSKVRVPAALVVSIWLISAVVIDQNFAIRSILNRTQPQPAREMANILAPRLEDGDVVLNVLGEGNESSLALHPMVQYFENLPGRIEILEIATRPSVQNYVARVEEAVGDANRLWLTYDLRFVSTEWSLLTYWLNEHDIYQCATIRDDDVLRILAFGRLTDDAPIYQFGSGIQVQTIGDVSVRDGVLRVWLGFDVPQDTPPYTYSVALHVEDANGQMATQADYGLPNAGRSCHMVEIPLSQVAGSDYHLQTIIYNWQTGERLTATMPDGETGDSAVIDISEDGIRN